MILNLTSDLSFKVIGDFKGRSGPNYSLVSFSLIVY